MTATHVTALMCCAGLDPADWDLAEIVRKTNVWIRDYRVELTDPEVETWSAAAQIEHYAEFGRLNAVDFFEQCVIEAGPSSAPWEALAARADADEFAAWPPVWEAEIPANLRAK